MAGKRLFQIGLALGLTALAHGTPRQVVFEEFTGTWCHWCPYTAVALSQLQRDAGTDNMLTISYHISDPFSNTDSDARNTFYSVSGYPTTIADGVRTQVGSYGDIRQDSAAFAGFYSQRRGIASPLALALTGAYNPGTRSGGVRVNVTNTGGSQILNHRLRYVIVETVPYRWQWVDTCWEVCRKMLPNASGVVISLNPGQTVADSQSFTMGTGWVEARTWLAAFVQNDGTKEILQGGWVPLSAFTAVEGGPPAEPEKGDVALAQNRPNPVRGSTEIAFSLPRSGEVRLSVYDAQGRFVRALAAGTRPAGTHSVTVSGLRSGVYFYRLEAGSTSLTREMVVAK